LATTTYKLKRYVKIKLIKNKLIRVVKPIKSRVTNVFEIKNKLLTLKRIVLLITVFKNDEKIISVEN
jgi:hypothetical protein